MSPLAFRLLSLGLLSASPLCVPPVSAAEQPFTLRFRAVVGSRQARCGVSYPQIGLTRSSIRLVDFRLYVSEFRLVARGGGEVPFTLRPDGLWQSDSVALLDFEDGTADCANGTPETRATVDGTAPPGEYGGLAFNVGVPQALNHRDPTGQPSPLNLSRLFWTWNSGYKFARVDLKTKGQPRGWVFHLGSTGCVPTGNESVPATSCGQPNRVRVSLAGFDPLRDVIELDLATLLEATDVDANQAQTASGCMSSQADRGCEGLFRQLGLPFSKVPAGRQRVFRVATREAARALAR